MFVGCTEAETKATTTQEDVTAGATDNDAAEKTKPAGKVTSDETTNASEVETQKPALASDPPTVYEVSQVIDVRTLPRLEVVQSYDQQVGSMYYVAKSDLKTAAAFYEKLYTDAGWKPSTEMGGRHENETSCQMALEKNGYLAFFAVSADEENPGQINISVNTFPNLDARQLPHAENCEVLHGSQASMMLVSEASVKDVAEATREILIGAGWTEHSQTPMPSPEMAVINLVKNGIGLLAYISKAPAQGGKTTVQYAFTIMANDVPLPPGASNIQLTESTPRMDCVAPGDLAKNAAFYRKAYAKVGYEAIENLSKIGEKKAALVFQTASGTSPSRKLVLVELTAEGGLTRVHLEPLSDENIDLTQELADSKEATDDAEMAEQPIGLVDTELMDDLAEESAEAMEVAEATPSHPAVVRTFGDGNGSVKTLSLSRDGKYLATGGYSFIAYDLATGERINAPAPFSDVNATTYSPDSKLLALGLSDGGLIVWDVAKEEAKYELEGGEYSIERLCFSPDGTTLAVADSDGDLTLLKADDGEVIKSISAHEGLFNGLAFSPDGKLLATARDQVRLWDVTSGERVTEFKEPEGAIIGDIAFSPDGKTLAVAGFDSNIELWDIAAAKRTQVLEDHDSPVATVAFSPDGTLLASGSWGFEVVLWDAASGKRLRVLSGHAQSVNDLAFSADGTQLATGADDGLVRLWDVRAALEHPNAEEPVADLANSPYAADDGFELEEETIEGAAAEEMPDEDFADDFGEMNQDEVEGLPLPPENQGLSNVGTQFARTIETSVRSPLAEVLAFYVAELTERGFLPAEESDVNEEQVMMKFTGPEGPLTLTLEKFGAETRIKMDLKRTAVAKAAGILPEAGKARVIVGNSTEFNVSITIGKVKLEAGPGEGIDRPDGPTANLEPGKYTVTVVREGASPQEEAVELKADETWGVMVVPPGPAIIQLY